MKSRPTLSALILYGCIAREPRAPYPFAAQPKAFDRRHHQSHGFHCRDRKPQQSYYYRSSKAALNAAMKGFALELKPQQIGVLFLHPGWVRTRMGGPNGLLSPQQSVESMRIIVDAFTPTNNDRFLRYDGSEIPW